MTEHLANPRAGVSGRLEEMILFLQKTKNNGRSKGETVRDATLKIKDVAFEPPPRKRGESEI